MSDPINPTHQLKKTNKIDCLWNWESFDTKLINEEREQWFRQEAEKRNITSEDLNSEEKLWSLSPPPSRAGARRLQPIFGQLCVSDCSATCHHYSSLFLKSCFWPCALFDFLLLVCQPVTRQRLQVFFLVLGLLNLPQFFDFSGTKEFTVLNDPWGWWSGPKPGQIAIIRPDYGREGPWHDSAAPLVGREQRV